MRPPTALDWTHKHISLGFPSEPRLHLHSASLSEVSVWILGAPCFHNLSPHVCVVLYDLKASCLRFQTVRVMWILAKGYQTSQKYSWIHQHCCLIIKGDSWVRRVYPETQPSNLVLSPWEFIFLSTHEWIFLKTDIFPPPVFKKRSTHTTFVLRPHKNSKSVPNAGTNTQGCHLEKKN